MMMINTPDKTIITKGIHRIVTNDDNYDLRSNYEQATTIS